MSEEKIGRKPFSRIIVPVPSPRPIFFPSHEDYATLEEFEEEYCQLWNDDSKDERQYFKLHEDDPNKRLQMIEWFRSENCQQARSAIFDGKRRDHTTSCKIRELRELARIASMEEADSEAILGRTVEEIKNVREILGLKVAKALNDINIAELVRELTAAVEYPKNFTRSLDAFCAIGRFVSLKERLPTGAPELQSFMADRRMKGKEMTSENLQKELKKLGFHPL